MRQTNLTEADFPVANLPRCGTLEGMVKGASLDAIVVRELIESVRLVAWAPADHVRLRELVEHVELVDRRCACSGGGGEARAHRAVEFRRALTSAAAIGDRYR